MLLSVVGIKLEKKGNTLKRLAFMHPLLEAFGVGRGGRGLNLPSTALLHPCIIPEPTVGTGYLSKSMVTGLQPYKNHKCFFQCKKVYKRTPFRTLLLQCSSPAKTHASNDVTLLSKSSCSIQSLKRVVSFPRFAAHRLDELEPREDDSCEIAPGT